MEYRIGSTWMQLAEPDGGQGPGRLKCFILCSMSAILLWSGCRDHAGGDHVHSAVDPQYHPSIHPSRFPDQIILNLSEDPLSSIAVNWRTNQEVGHGYVQIAKSTHGPGFRNSVRMIDASTQVFSNQYHDEPEVKSHYHSGHVDGLTAGEQYVYRVGADTLWSEWFQIRMPSPSDQGLRFIYFGDAQNQVKSMWSRVVRAAFSEMPDVDFLLHAGDLINRSDRDLEWAEWFGAGSFIHAMVPSMMTPGNHEYSNVVLSPQWRPQFNLPLNGPKGLEETCYQINYPKLKLISLDAEQIDETPHLRDAQMEWLDSILHHDPRQWTVLTLHYPFYSTKPDRDNPELRAAFKPIVDRHRIDLVLQGHDHAYGRGAVQNEGTGVSYRDKEIGTVYVVSVSGPKMYDVGEHEWMSKRAGQTQLFQLIHIDGEKLTYEAYTAKGDLYDAFHLVKQNGRPNQLVEDPVELEERLSDAL